MSRCLQCISPDESDYFIFIPRLLFGNSLDLSTETADLKFNQDVITSIFVFPCSFCLLILPHVVFLFFFEFLLLSLLAFLLFFFPFTYFYFFRKDIHVTVGCWYNL